MFTPAYFKSMAERALKTFLQVVVAVAGADQLGWIKSVDFTYGLKLAAIAAVLSMVTTTYNKLRGKEVPETDSIEKILKDAASMYEMINEAVAKAPAKKKATPKKKSTTP